jgi:hypothetical protein
LCGDDHARLGVDQLECAVGPTQAVAEVSEVETLLDSFVVTLLADLPERLLGVLQERGQDAEFVGLLRLPRRDLGMRGLDGVEPIESVLLLRVGLLDHRVQSRLGLADRLVPLLRARAVVGSESVGTAEHELDRRDLALGAGAIG